MFSPETEQAATEFPEEAAAESAEASVEMSLAGARDRVCDPCPDEQQQATRGVGEAEVAGIVVVEEDVKSPGEGGEENQSVERQEGTTRQSDLRA